MNDPDLSKEQKLTRAIDLYFDSYDTVSNAINTLLFFYTCGVERKLHLNGKSVRAIYSFEHDAGYIFSAFLAQYNIDLNVIEYMHWWKFKALFESLNEDHLISKIMSYRSMDLSQIKDKEQRKYYRKLKMAYRLPDNRTDEEKEKDFTNALG